MKKFVAVGALSLLLSASVMSQLPNIASAEGQAAPKADVVTTASIVNKQDAFIKAISEKGTWIIATLGDLKFTQELVVAGEFHDKGDAKNALYRKIAPYTQDDKHNIIDRFTITAPKMTIKSTNAKIQGGTFVGDVYVEANGFTIQDAKVQGNVYFAKEEYQKSFKLDKGTVTGVTQVKVDVVTTASIVNKEDAFVKAVSEKGNWIVATLNNLKFTKEVVVAGEFHDKGNAKSPLYRKLALCTQDANYKILDRFTLTVPKLTIKSPNTKISGGTIIGDVYVQANGFTLEDAKVQGNIYFAKAEYQKSFNMSNKGVVTGTMKVK